MANEISNSEAKIEFNYIWNKASNQRFQDMPQINQAKAETKG